MRFIMQDSFSFRVKSADSVSMWQKGGQDRVTGGGVLWVFFSPKFDNGVCQCHDHGRSDFSRLMFCCMMIVRGFGEGGADHLPPGCCIPSQALLTKHQACGGVGREFGRQEGGREAGRQQGGRGEGRQAPLDKCSQIEISPEEAPPSTSRSYITSRIHCYFHTGQYQYQQECMHH